jgi:hypothetical protein
MNPRDPFKADDAGSDELDQKIREALKEEGVIIPKTVEDVRRAKARLKAHPVTVPPHLRDSATILRRVLDEKSQQAEALSHVPALGTGGRASGQKIHEEDKRSFEGGATLRHTKGIFFRRAAFDAYIIHALPNDENLGRTKIEKVTHLAEYHCGVDCEREPVRDAAGPVDYGSRRKVESLAKKQGWYSAVDAENRLGVRYVPGPNLATALPIAERMLCSRKPAVDALIALMRPLNTKRCEIVATLYAAWNDLLLRGESPTDEEILHEARDSWHPNKLRIAKQRWIGALGWMREHHLVPKGTGRSVPPAA